MGFKELYQYLKKHCNLPLLAQVLGFLCVLLLYVLTVKCTQVNRLREKLLFFSESYLIHEIFSTDEDFDPCSKVISNIINYWFLNLKTYIAGSVSKYLAWTFILYYTSAARRLFTSMFWVKHRDDYVNTSFLSVLLGSIEMSRELKHARICSF